MLQNVDKVKLAKTIGAVIAVIVFAAKVLFGVDIPVVPEV